MIEAREMSPGDDSAVLAPQTAPRKRPLRTYGRRAQPLPDRDSEPPCKKRIVEDSSRRDNTTSPAKAQDENSPPSSPQLPKLPVAPPPTAVKKGSILAFFKPVPTATSSSAVPSQISSDATRDDVAPSSPPSSPPVIPRHLKKKRRLTTRINLPSSRRDDGEGEQESEEQALTTTAKEDPVDNDDRKEQVTAMPGHASVLQALHSSLLNSVAASDGPQETFKVKHEAKRRVHKATVQTTLNLSMSDRPGFTICKECDMLYNPLNEKDRKDHARQHAAAMRRKAKAIVP